MRKYIQIAKFMKPVLTDAASEVIAEEYSRLRSQDALEADVARVGITGNGSGVSTFFSV